MALSLADAALRRRPDDAAAASWFSLGFVAFFALQILNWLRPMTWTRDDRRWMRRMQDYVTNAETLEPEYVGFFNAGQKLYFWAIVGERRRSSWSPASRCGFRRRSAGWRVAISYVLHDIAALVMLVGFIVHIYEGTAAAAGHVPGDDARHGRRSGGRGRIIPRGIATSTGRDPRADYERALARESERR